MTQISQLRARAVAASRANSEDWDSDPLWDDEAGPSWTKDFTGGYKHRLYPVSQPSALADHSLPT